MKSITKTFSSLIDKYSKTLNKRQFYEKSFKWIFDFIASNFTILVCVVLLSLLFYLINKKNRINEGFTNQEPPFPIDIVYTWAGEKKNSTDTRQADHNELKYSLRSVNMHMPWVNHIYIFMNSPKKMPSWMKNNKKITFIEHDELFKTDTPNTNSNALETYLHKIPGLSEHFIYFNDDVFVGRSLHYTEFFSPEGKLKVPKKTVDVKDMKIAGKTPKVSFELPPFPEWWYPHIPIPMKKSQTQKFHERYPEYINWVRGIKKRIGTGCDECENVNLKCPCQQQHFPLQYFAYKNNDTEFRDETGELPFIKLDKLLKDGIKEMDVIKTSKPKFFCLADFGALNNDDREKIRNLISKFCDEFYYVRPDFEI